MSAGVLYVHSCPPVLCPHVEWAVAAELGTRARMEWSDQPAAPGQLRAEINWRGRPGTAGRLAAAQRGWTLLRYEVTEEPSPGHEGARYSYTPELGVFAAVTGVHGDILVTEDRIKAALVKAALGEVQLDEELRRLLGKPWDDELEPFRHAGERSPVVWLHRAG